MSDHVMADLTAWATRARADLQHYATAARDAGSPIEETEALVAELDDILAGRPIWQRQMAQRGTAGTPDCCQTRFAQKDVFGAICEERRLQDEKWGSLEDKQQSVAGYLLILESELEEAKAGWMKNKTGRHSALSEILQIATVAVACLQQYGTEGNPL